MFTALTFLPCGLGEHFVANAAFWKRKGYQRSMQRLLYQNKYARAAHVVNVAIIFCCIAPLVTLPVLVWLALVTPVWSHNLRGAPAAPPPFPPPPLSHRARAAQW